MNKTLPFYFLFATLLFILAAPRTAQAQSLGLLWVDVKATHMDNRNCIQWSTAQENTANSVSYQVQKSEDGKTWTNTGKPVPALRGLNINSYSWYDSAVSMPKALYRIRLNTIDEHYMISDIVSIVLKGAGNLVLYPNPVRDRLYITSDNVQAQMKTFEVYDRFGRCVAQMREGQAITQYNFSTNHLPVGIYTLVIELADGSKSVHLFIHQ